MGKKERISATVDTSTIKKIKEILAQGRFRNKSHVIEEAITTLHRIQLEKGEGGST